MRDTRLREKILDGKKFTTVICVEGDDFLVEVIFHHIFIGSKYGEYIRFSFNRIKPNVFREMVNKNYVIFVPMSRKNGRSPDIREN